MGFNDFWINNNGKKEHLNNAKHGVRKDQMDKKFHNLFDAYDANGDETLETKELDGVFKGLTKFAGADKTLDSTENKQVASLFANQAGIQDADFMGFVRSVSKATENIVDLKETPTADGGREVTTTYKDGSVETISYYPDGEYKFKKLDQKGSSTTNYYTIGNNLDKHYTADEIESRVKKAYDKRVAEIKQRAKQNSGIEGRGSVPIIPNYDEFKKGYLQHFNINQGSDTHNFERHDFELSERGKQDVAVRDFVLSHYIDTHKAAQEALETMGILDDVGAAINAGAGELWNSIKNVWNGTQEEYQNFYELSKKFEPNYNKALRESSSLDVMRNNPEIFFRDFETDFKKDMGHQYNLENSVQFQQTAEQYQNAQILKQRIDILNKAMQEVRMYQTEQDALVYSPAQSEGLNPASHIISANNLLLQYFNNDQEAVDMILNGTIGNAEATIKAISGIKEDTEKLNKAVLDGKTFDQIQNDYKSQYKAMYGTDFVPDEITEKVMDAKATGGMVKLAGITIVSILITKSPIMAEISAAAGGAEVSGAAANMIRTLAAKYGPEVVQKGIKLAMTSGTLATDVGLTLINQATSERGVNGEELWESTKGSAKYIFFGAYVGAPLAQAVSKSLGKIGATARLFEGGVKTGDGAIQTTSITGDKLLQNFMKGGNTALAKGGAFLTEVGAFAGLDVATEDVNITDALAQQGSFLPKLKVMNHVLEYMLGAKAHTATSKTNLDAAIEKSGVKNWNIKEIKTPQKTKYVVDIDGLPVGKFEDANQLATAMLERVTANFKTTQSFGLNDKSDEPTVTATKKSPAKPSEGVKVEDPKPEVKEDKPVAQINTGASGMREAEMIKRYNELQAESERTGVVSEELLTLTMELSDKGYHFKNGKLDFSYNENQTNMPNSDVSKAEFIKGLKEYGINKTALENIEYNVNRINMDLLNQLKESPELLNSTFGVSILCDVKPEDVPAKIEAFKLLKDIELLSPKSKVLMINKAGKNSLDAVKQNIEDFNYIKESGIDPSIISSYELVMVEDNMHFNREMFDLLKDNKEFVDKPYLSFNVNPNDIPAKTEVYSLLKDNSSCPVEQKVSILEKCNKDNLTKIKMVESYRADGINERTVRNLYENLDNIDENILAAVKDNASLLDYYEASEIPTIKPEDMSAKARIALELFLYSIDKNSKIAQELIKQTTKDNIKTIHKKMAMIQAFSPFTTTRSGTIKNDIISEIQDGSIDVDVVSELFKTIQHDKELLKAISLNKDLKILKDVTAEDVKAKKEIYDFVFSLTIKRVRNGKPTLLHVDKADLLNRTTQDNIAEIKEELSIDYRLAEVKSLEEPQFTQKEMLLRKNKLRTLFENIDSQKSLTLEDKNTLKALFENAKTMEEFNAKYNAYMSMANKSNGNFSTLNNLAKTIDAVKIKEQADIIYAVGLDYCGTGSSPEVISKNFAQNYKYLKQIDSSFKPIGTFEPYRRAFDLKFDGIKSQEEFEMFKELWNDSNIDSNVISDIISDKNKYNEYKKLASNPDYSRMNHSDIELVIGAISKGKISEVTDVSSIAKDLRIQDIQKNLKDYRDELTRERYNWEKTATEEDMRGLNVTFPNLNKAKFENYTGKTVNIIQEVIQRNTHLSFNEIESVLNNNVDFSNCDKRTYVLRKCSPEIAFRLAFCSDKDFNKVVDVLERRPEMLLEKFDSSNFDKMLKMSDREWENFKVSIRDRGETEFNEAQYAADIQAKLDGGFELDMSTYRAIERERKLETNSGLGYAPKKTIKYDPSNNSERVMTPVVELPSAEQLLSQLETTGKIALSIEDKGGMNPTRNDRAEIKEKDRGRLGKAVSTDIVLNIGASRPWENSRLARDLIQNFYDGNGYTMEGIDIHVEKVGNKYNVKISGKGIYDYDRVLNFGYGSKVNDTRSAGQHGEGSKIVLGNLLYSRGADHVKYSAGKWELDFTADKTKKPSESEIMQTLTEVEKAQDGTSLEFETTDLDLVKELVKAKDYFYSPQNKDFANLDFENEYFGMKFLPKGEKGNMYVIQRYEVEGSEGLDGTMDGMTLIFKTKPEDQTLTELNNGVPFSLETGRNRVALSRQKITEMITRYAKTLSDEQLINIIGNMKEVFLFDNQNKNTHILKGFAKVAQERNIKIDFGHDDYIAVDSYSNDRDVRFAKMMGKTLVTHEMSLVGIPDLHSYMRANEGHRTPVTDLTETQAHKLQILEETVKMFSDNLDLANCGIITKGEAKAPKYLYEPTEKDNTVAEAIISRDLDHTYQGHWVKADYLDSGNFFDLVATWLHETSHKVAGDGNKYFNDRLIKLEQLIVDISNSDPSFGQKLRVLAQKYNEVSQKAPEDNSAYPKMTVRETDQMISDILRLVATEAEEKAKVQQTQTTKNKTKVNDETSDISETTTATEPEVNDNILTRFFKKIFGSKKIKPANQPKPEPRNSARGVIKDAPNEPKYVYTSPKKGVRTSGENQFTTYQDHIETLKATGRLDIAIPVTDKLHPIKGSTEIKPEDRAVLDRTVNTPLMLDYNSAQEWTYDMVARDILQNFYDGHGGTLDGVKIDIQKVDGKYKVKISGESEYNYFYLKNIAASSKTGDENQAGGYGEGAKMASKSLLGAYVTDKITFASGDWAMDFAREEGVERQDMHMTRTLHENSQRVNGTYVEFETANADLVESIIKAKDFYQHADNPDFKGLDFENGKFGFKILNENEKGNLYYNQRYAVKSDGELEGALNGISIVFKKELTTKDKKIFRIANDCDRRGLTSEEIKSISTCMAKSMSDQELMSSIQQLERFWSVKDPRVLKQNNRVMTPEEGFAIGLIEEARNRRLKFNVDAQKVVAVDPFIWNINIDHVNNLKSQGYVIADESLANLGFKTVSDVMKQLNKVVPVEGTIVEKQKLALITEALPQKLPLKIFEASPDDNQVCITSENGEQFIAIDRRYLEKTDFNTLYTQILSRVNYASDSAEWGYRMTEMLAQQLRLANDPNYMAKFNAIAKRYSQIK